MQMKFVGIPQSLTPWYVVINLTPFTFIPRVVLLFSQKHYLSYT